LPRNRDTTKQGDRERADPPTKRVKLLERRVDEVGRTMEKLFLWVCARNGAENKFDAEVAVD
jgi:hypothetical protein